MQISLALLYIANMFVNELKTIFFTEWFLNTKKEFTNPFEKISPQELKKCLQKFYLSARNATAVAVRSLRAKIVIVGNSK